MVLEPGSVFKQVAVNRIETVIQRDWPIPPQEIVANGAPVLEGKYMYLRGERYALDTKTGKIHYRRQLEIPSAGGMPGMEAANIYGSLTMAGRHLLLTNDIGDTLVLAPGSVYRKHSHNYLDEGSGATAVADGRLLLLRGTKQLYCIGSK